MVAIDAKRREDGSGWEVFLNGGRLPTGREAVAWAAEAAERGAGELLVTSMDRDGTHDGFDVELLAAVAEAAPVPVIASGGAGSLEHFGDAVTRGHADAVLAASVFHDGVYSIAEVKRAMATAGVAGPPVGLARVRIIRTESAPAPVAGAPYSQAVAAARGRAGVRVGPARRSTRPPARWWRATWASRRAWSSATWPRSWPRPAPASPT